MVQPQERRCPSCGALVGRDADWCGQCFTSLAEPEPQVSEGAIAAAGFLSVQSRSSSSAIGGMAVTFLLIAIAIYAVTALDARRLASGREQVLSSRALVWISAGLVLFSIGSAGLILAQGFESVRK